MIVQSCPRFQERIFAKSSTSLAMAQRFLILGKSSTLVAMAQRLSAKAQRYWQWLNASRQRFSVIDNGSMLLGKGSISLSKRSVLANLLRYMLTSAITSLTK